MMRSPLLSGMVSLLGPRWSLRRPSFRSLAQRRLVMASAGQGPRPSAANSDSGKDGGEKAPLGLASDTAAVPSRDDKASSGGGSRLAWTTRRQAMQLAGGFSLLATSAAVTGAAAPPLASAASHPPARAPPQGPHPMGSPSAGLPVSLPLGIQARRLTLSLYI